MKTTFILIALALSCTVEASLPLSASPLRTMKVPASLSKNEVMGLIFHLDGGADIEIRIKNVRDQYQPDHVFGDIVCRNFDAPEDGAPKPSDHAFVVLRTWKRPHGWSGCAPLMPAPGTYDYEVTIHRGWRIFGTARLSFLATDDPAIAAWLLTMMDDEVSRQVNARPSIGAASSGHPFYGVGKLIVE